MPFSDKGMANLLSMSKLIDDGNRILIDTSVDDDVRVFTKDDRNVVFKRSKNGSHCHDTENRQLNFMSSQHENSLMCTASQIKKAKVARDSYQMVGYPSLDD